MVIATGGILNLFKRNLATKKLKNYPHYTFFDLFKFNVLKGIRIVSVLNYIDYNKEEVMQFLTRRAWMGLLRW